jgi:hypothetical protein
MCKRKPVREKKEFRSLAVKKNLKTEVEAFRWCRLVEQLLDEIARTMPHSKICEQRFAAGPHLSENACHLRAYALAEEKNHAIYLRFTYEDRMVSETGNLPISL